MCFSHIQKKKIKSVNDTHVALYLNNMQLRQVKVVGYHYSPKSFIGLNTFSRIDQNFGIYRTHILLLTSSFPIKKNTDILYHSVVLSYILFGLTVYGSVYTANTVSKSHKMFRIIVCTTNRDSVAFAYRLRHIG